MVALSAGEEGERSMLTSKDGNEEGGEGNKGKGAGEALEAPSTPSKRSLFGGLFGRRKRGDSTSGDDREPSSNQKKDASDSEEASSRTATPKSNNPHTHTHTYFVPFLIPAH